MTERQSPAPRLLALATLITIAVFATGFCKIADLDFWWHLRTGKLIVEEGAIPHRDVYSYTALGREYVDHEWLFQVIQWAVYSAGGPLGVMLFKSAIFSITFVTIALYVVRRRGVSTAAAGGLVLLAIAGGVTRLIERPEMFSTLFTVLTFILLERFRDSSNVRYLFALPLICAVWANIHAAVIVGLLIQGAFLAASLIEGSGLWAPGSGAPSPRPRALIFVLVASIIAAFVNPVGPRVLSVPFELTAIINSGVINNVEWRPPTLRNSPFFFVSAALTIGLLLTGFRRAGVARLLVGAFLAFISFRYIRNVGLFCAFMPLLIAPEVARWRREASATLAAAGAVALLFILTLYYPFQRGVGEASYFPDGLVRFVEQENLQGRMLNSYGIGGYLIWRLFPERLVFIDGRNEVYLPLLQRLQVARRDSREWTRLLREYGVEYAVLEYVDTLDRVTIMGVDGRTTTTLAPVSVSRFPRSRWALVHWDDDGMIFVRRAGRNAALASREYAAVVPEGRDYTRSQIEAGAVSREAVLADLRRKLSEDPASRRAQALLDSIQKR